MPSSLEQEIRGLRIVVGGLIWGLVSFAAIASRVAPIMRGPARDDVRWILAAVPVLGLACAVGYFTLRRNLMRTVSERTTELRQSQRPEELIIEAYRRFVIARGGLIEGPGFLSVIAYMMTGEPLALGAVGLAVGLLALHFPSRSALKRILEDASAP